VNFELQPTTDAGERLVKLAEEHAIDFATRADEHDRENTFPVENFEAMKQSGVLAACVPEQFGGMGVDSLHDLTLAINRLARGCASTAISANMHMAGLWNLARSWRDAKARGETEAADGIEAILPAYGASQWIMCGAGTEAGTRISHPLTEATPADGGYRINGHKIFGTNSEIADVFGVFLRVPDGDGGYLSGFAVVFRGADGLDIKDNWDSLGMRGSKSHDIVFRDCFVPKEMLWTWGPWGGQSEDGYQGLAGLIGVNFPLVGAFLGIAEAARDLVVDAVTTRRKAPSDRLMAEHHEIQRLVAEIEIELAKARAILGTTLQTFDDYVGSRVSTELERDAMFAVMKDVQCAKLVVQRAAIDAVDKAMTACGGSSFLSSSPLSRHYRDVRAGPFMQPFSPVEAYEYIGKVALGLDPTPEM
jgi:alkylation response protein AidB-like acyl-CoA dehydrogenase